MNPATHSTLEALCHTGTVRGVCLTRRGEIIENLFPFSETRMQALCDEAEGILDDFAARDRSVDRLVFGFDGGHLVVVVDGDLRLLLMHMMPDEADFVAKAARALLHDFNNEVTGVEVVGAPSSQESAAKKRKVVPMPKPRKAAAKSKSARAAARKTKPVAGGETPKMVAETKASPTAGDSKSVDELWLEDFEQILAEAEKPAEEPVSPAPVPVPSPPPATLRELVAASHGATASPSAEVRLVIDADSTPNAAVDETDGKANVTVPAQVDVDSDSVPGRKTPPARVAAAARPVRSSSGRKAVVGAVVVQPARLAAHQPQSTLPPPKKPRIRRAAANETSAAP